MNQFSTHEHHKSDGEHAHSQKNIDVPGTDEERWSWHVRVNDKYVSSYPIQSVTLNARVMSGLKPGWMVANYTWQCTHAPYGGNNPIYMDPDIIWQGPSGELSFGGYPKIISPGTYKFKVKGLATNGMGGFKESSRNQNHGNEVTLKVKQPSLNAYSESTPEMEDALIDGVIEDRFYHAEIQVPYRAKCGSKVSLSSTYRNPCPESNAGLIYFQGFYCLGKNPHTGTLAWNFLGYGDEAGSISDSVFKRTINIVLPSPEHAPGMEWKVYFRSGVRCTYHAKWGDVFTNAAHTVLTH